MNVIEIIKQLNEAISIPELLICLVGLILFACWLLKTSLGRKALADSLPRRNNMPLYLPFIPFFIWGGTIAIAISITGILLPDLPDWQSALWDNFILCTGAIITIVVIIHLARASFARRLKGFGLNAKTILKDFFVAFVNLLSVWPLVMVAIILTTFFGKLIWGQDFYLEQHEGLKTITAYPQLPLRVLIIVTTVVVAPVLEEMLFRGLFQTAIRSFFSPVLRGGSTSEDGDFGFQISGFRSCQSAWLAILISSGLFAMVHSNAGHWPALFILALCLGYSYEKSGSLFRPIFIHSFFNAITIIAVLNQ